MIKKSEIAEAIKSLITSGKPLEEALYLAVQQQIKHLPAHLKEDPEALSDVVAAAQYCAREAHPEFESASNLHDLTLKRLLPRKKTFAYIERLEDEA